jgi:hypothetical protein
MGFADMETYVPYLTAFIGLIISWIFMLVASGHAPQVSESRGDRIISQMI